MGSLLLPPAAAVPVFLLTDRIGVDSECGQLWLFAILGTVLSVVQLLVYSVVARQSRWSVYLIWAGLLALLVATRGVDDATSLAVVVTVVDAVVLVALLAASLHRIRPGATAPADASRADATAG